MDERKIKPKYELNIVAHKNTDGNEQKNDKNLSSTHKLTKGYLMCISSSMFGTSPIFHLLMRYNNY